MVFLDVELAGDGGGDCGRDVVPVVCLVGFTAEVDGLWCCGLLEGGILLFWMEAFVYKPAELLYRH